MLFTVIADYHGGTYMSQWEADDVHAAVYQWADSLPEEDLRLMKLTRADAQSITGDSPVCIEGLKNAWCTTTLAGGHSLMLNIIATSA